MDTLILALLLTSNLSVALLILLLLHRLRAVETNIRGAMTNWITAPDDKTPSPFAQLVDQIAAVVAARVGTSVMAAIRGALGGTAKASNAEALQGAMEESPALGLVGALSPTLAKRLGRNPLAIGALQHLLGGIVGTRANSGNNKDRKRASWDYGA